MPDVLTPQKEELEETQWEAIKTSIADALNQVDEFRIHEGKALYYDITKRIGLILDHLKHVDTFENKRAEKIKERILKELDTLSEKIQYDKNRFEQEMIYFLDKLDINEEVIWNNLKLILNKLVANDRTRAMIEAAQRSLPSIISGVFKKDEPSAEYITKEEFTRFKESLIQRLKTFIGEAV